jgi:hypothetical protein
MSEAAAPHESVAISKRKGYLYLATGIVFLLSPIVSVALEFLPSPRFNNNNDDGVDGTHHRLYEYWNEIAPFVRPLTILPATIVICICHWVSLRIYLRR